LKAAWREATLETYSVRGVATQDQDQDLEAKPAVLGLGDAWGGGGTRRAERIQAVARALLSQPAARKVPQLLDAARRGDTAAVADLLTGPDPPPLDATDWEGCTPLILAARRGSVEVVRLLLRGGQRVNGRDYSGWTALMYAAKRNHREVVKALLATPNIDRCASNRHGLIAEDLTTCPILKGLLRVRGGIPPAPAPARHPPTIKVRPFDPSLLCSPTSDDRLDACGVRSRSASEATRSISTGLSAHAPCPPPPPPPWRPRGCWRRW
jgi:ankyrin repeat protein